VFGSIIAPLVARHKLGDKVSKEQVLATIRKMLSMNGSIKETLEACEKLLFALNGNTNVLRYIQEDEITK